MALEHLFDAELQYQPGMAPLIEEGEGVLVGSGNGTVAGPVRTAIEGLRQGPQGGVRLPTAEVRARS